MLGINVMHCVSIPLELPSTHVAFAGLYLLFLHTGRKAFSSPDKPIIMYFYLNSVNCFVIFYENNTSCENVGYVFKVGIHVYCVHCMI